MTAIFTSDFQTDEQREAYETGCRFGFQAALDGKRIDWRKADWTRPNKPQFLGLYHGYVQGERTMKAAEQYRSEQ